MVAERATLEQISVDRIADAILKAFLAVDSQDSDMCMDKVLGKLSMTSYTYEGLGGTAKALVDDGQRHGMFEVKNIDDVWEDFLSFHRSTHQRMSWEQSAAVYWSRRIPDCWLVSDSEQVLDFANGLGVPVMSVEEMQETFFADEEFDAVDVSPAPPFVVAPFDPRVDADKVEAAFSDGLEGDLAVLKQKSYWVVVCVLFEWFGWLRLRHRADFCKWVNAHFHFDKPIDADIDLKSAINKIKVKERNLELWPDNQYRDLAYLLMEKFFGERQGLPNGFYVYAREPLYLKPGKMWRRKD